MDEKPPQAAECPEVSPRKREALALFAGLPSHDDLIAALFSFGQDPYWRRSMVRELARELARVVKGGGAVASLEFHVPPRLPVRLAWRLHCRLGLRLLGRVVSRDWHAAGSLQRPNIEQFYRRQLQDVIAMWQDAGIEQVHARPVSLGGGVVMWGVWR
ncbi:MAG TPA: class I SAM-dependent methyltransferase [Solirubrobacteraceae bacterium]|jgi:hypothetical protein|nr:class I SAM-dependent methyltransferase [Solirubrobacteraceae bacterium]